MSTGQALRDSEVDSLRPSVKWEANESSVFLLQRSQGWTSSLESVPLRRSITLLGCFTCLQSQNSVAQNTGTWLFFFFLLAKRDIILMGSRDEK